MKNKVIAITGGIGSGKSEVTKYLQSLGYATLDCDALAKEISTRPQVVEQVRRLLGDEYISDGQLNRKAIRDKVFSAEDLLEQYNAIFFCEVKSLLCKRLEDLSDNKYIFVEISVFDAFEYPWDEVWLIDSCEHERKQRVVARDGISQQTLDDIVWRQHICADFTLKIVNNGSLSNLKIKVDNALKTFDI